MADPRKQGGRNAAEQRKQHLEALEAEQRGYEARGLDDRAKQVAAQIKALTSNATRKPEGATERAEQTEVEQEQPATEQDDAATERAEQTDAEDEPKKPAPKRGKTRR